MLLLSQPTVFDSSFETKRSRSARCTGLCHSLVLRVTHLSTAKGTKWRVIYSTLSQDLNPLAPELFFLILAHSVYRVFQKDLNDLNLVYFTY